MKTQSRSLIPTLLAAGLVCAGSSLAQTPALGAVPLMKAVVYDTFGSPDVLRIADIPRPVPDDDQILVRVRAASVNPLDWHFMEGTPYLARLISFGALRPTVTRLGVDFAGTVESVGKNVTRFKPGDDVFGGKTGAFAEYVCVRADRAVALKPANVTFEQAAVVPIAALTALQGLRDNGKLQPGQRVLINGASGGVGTFAVQIAKSFGADVTGVCSTKNLDMVRSIGADRVIDYTKDDFTSGAERYDLIIDNVANRSLSECRRVLKPNGKYVMIGGGGLNEGRWVGPFPRLIKALALSPFVSQDMGMMLADMNVKDLAVLADLMQAGKVTPVIDRRYSLRDVPEAIRYLEQGHARGKVVIVLDQESGAPSAHAEPAATPVNRLGPGVVLLVLLGTIVGVPVVPIVAALALDRRFRRRNPGKRPYRWGYYFGILSFLGGVGLGLMLESGTGAVIVCGAIYAVLAWLFVQRRRWAWVALTILSFNPVAWVINFFYLRKRWAEDIETTPAIAAGG
jgi:NADPH:quinone reductase-like Zn-dependent oxidoreductase